MNLISSVPLLQTLTDFHLFCCIFCFQKHFSFSLLSVCFDFKTLFYFHFGCTCSKILDTKRQLETTAILWKRLEGVGSSFPLFQFKVLLFQLSVSLGVIMTWWCLIWKKSKRGEIQLEVPTQFVNNITFASQLLLAFFRNLSSKNIF